MSWPARSSCWGRMLCRRSRSLTMMRCPWKTCILSSRRTPPWCPSSLISIPRIRVHLGNTFSTFSTPSTQTISDSWWNMQASNEWLSRATPWRKNPFRCQSSGRSNFDKCHIFRVSQLNKYLRIRSNNHIFISEKNGKTLHLLKASSKPTKSGIKRK